MTDYNKIEKEVDAVSDMIWDVASNVWEYAELGYKEFESSSHVSETLEKNGFAISDRGIGGLDTSWIASWGSGSPVLGILVEFDALPGLGNDTVPTHKPAKSGNTNGHGCGHNLIGSSSVGAAVALKNHMEKEKIAGTIKVVGCPAEELLNGKNYMAANGAFKGLDVCLHNHPGPVNTVWNFHSTASLDLWVEWQGRTAHAGAAPWEGRSALHAAEIFLVAANMMREQMLPTARLHYQILEGGMAVNVVPDYAKVLIRYRGPSAENVLQYKAWLEDMAKGAGLATQTTAKVTNLGGIYDCLPNDVLAKRMTEHMNQFFPIPWTDEEQAYAKSIQKEMGKPEDGLSTNVLPVPTGVEVGGSSDVGDVSWQIPTMGAVYASWPQHIPPHQWGCTACHGMSIGQKATVHAAKVLASTGLDLVTQPEFLKEVKDDFTKQLNGRKYKTLNDFEKNPWGKLGTEDVKHYECCIHSAMEHFGIKEHQ
ncbi:amidohydrolase [Draconibacterium sp. IB214405]|uniref:amidohydrolase n=1 Tax=Draconibacterium sp. IB214405 TaxID=3097352 RepID=UPI002A0C09DC|nr:amidohydrolase [Draconibacterium sp. IB214405]MDX8339033.1 amidohydrolase [Draconibacterium sp. IB214405]